MTDEDDRPALTAREHQILEAIKDYIQSHPWPPTHEEIGRLVGLSRGNVHYHLGHLEIKKYIAIQRGTFRGITVL